MASHRAHEHPLQQIDPNNLYAEYGGRWQCNNCDTEKQPTEIPYHCATCTYDICKSCFEAKQHVRHEHPLYYTKMIDIYPLYNGAWRCDACGETKGPPHEPNAYHCYQDQFDLCRDCFHGRLLNVHRHLLVPADTSILYRDFSTGSWQCDICGRNGQELGTQYSWHCSPCSFDCCEECRRGVQIEQHEHPLTIRDAFEIYQNNGAWRCDLCGDEKVPSSSSTTDVRERANDQYPFHCDVCQRFDACRRCVEGISVTGPGLVGRPGGGTPEGGTEERRHVPPVETYDDDDRSIEGLAESEICNICLQRPKDATLVHQGTGHQYCCMRCGFEIRNRDNRCPVCRREIDDIIKTFSS